jgi:hypothetical protein
MLIILCITLAALLGFALGFLQSRSYWRERAYADVEAALTAEYDKRQRARE